MLLTLFFMLIFFFFDAPFVFAVAMLIFRCMPRCYATDVMPCYVIAVYARALYVEARLRLLMLLLIRAHKSVTGITHITEDAQHWLRARLLFMPILCCC